MLYSLFRPVSNLKRACIQILSISLILISGCRLVSAQVICPAVIPSVSISSNLSTTSSLSFYVYNNCPWYDLRMEIYEGLIKVREDNLADDVPDIVIEGLKPGTQYTFKLFRNNVLIDQDNGTTLFMSNTEGITNDNLCTFGKKICVAANYINNNAPYEIKLFNQQGSLINSYGPFSTNWQTNPIQYATFDNLQYATTYTVQLWRSGMPTGHSIDITTENEPITPPPSPPTCNCGDANEGGQHGDRRDYPVNLGNSTGPSDILIHNSSCFENTIEHGYRDEDWYMVTAELGGIRTELITGTNQRVTMTLFYSDCYGRKEIASISGTGTLVLENNQSFRQWVRYDIMLRNASGLCSELKYTFKANSIPGVKTCGPNDPNNPSCSCNTVTASSASIPVQLGYNPLKNDWPDYEPNQTMTAAIPIGLNKTIFGYIHHAADRDWYKVTLTQSSKLNIALNYMRKDYDIRLYNSSGSIIGSSSNGIYQNEVINSNLLATGTYYIEVYGWNYAFSKTTGYELICRSITGNCTHNYEPNELISNAVQVSLNSTYSAAIQANGDVDFYQINLPKSSNSLSVTLNNLPADYDLYVLNVSGSTMGYSSAGNTTPDIVNLTNLPAGKYFIKVHGWNGANNASACYNLNISSNGNAAYKTEQDEFAELVYPPKEPKLEIENSLTDKIDEYSKILLYPNPTSSEFTIQLLSEQVNSTHEYIIQDTHGKIIKTGKFTGNSTSINLEGNSPGIYVIRISNQEMNVFEKLILQ